MKILLCGTFLDHKNKERGNLAGFNHAYKKAFEHLGHDVDSIMHGQAPVWPGKGYDLFLLRDVTVDTQAVARLAKRSEKFAMFTHAEFIQGRTMDVRFFEHMGDLGAMPDHVFLDQTLGGKRYEELGIDVPATFLGWGANMETARKEWRDKDIDILWVGHNYGERQPRVENLIFPLKDSSYNVKIHGRGQPDGPLSMPEMFDALSRAKIVVRISHKAHWVGGYSGRTIYDALASCAYVIHDEYPLCYDQFPYGVKFVPIEDIKVAVLHATKASRSFELIEQKAITGYHWVWNTGMVFHMAQRMIDILWRKE